MNESDDAAPEFASPAEERLHHQLEVVREEPPGSGSDLSVAVTHTLRWQAILVVPISAALAMAGGIVEGLRAFSGPRSSR